jgi:hypothetical protein
MIYFLNFFRSIGNPDMMVTVEDKESFVLPFIAANGTYR